MSYTDRDRYDFLKKLGKAADIDVTDWEAKFIEDNVEVPVYTRAQRETIDRMIAKYADRLKW